jgi:thymidylate synthase
MKIYQGNSFASVYRDLLNDLLNSPEYTCSPRGMEIREITDCALVIENPVFAMYENERRSTQEKYIAAEFLWYFAGRNDLSFIERFAKFWQHVANEDGTLNSAYGNLIFTKKNEHNISQWEWAYNSLVEDKDTRQAIMHFNMPEHQRRGNKDFVCTLTGIFQIRENKLNFTVNMRSNDAILGTPTDIPFFCVLQIQMLELLKSTYPDLELGTYTHFAHSLHIYERHFQLVEEMLKDDNFIAKDLPKIDQTLIYRSGKPNEKVLEMIDKIEKGESDVEATGEIFKWIYQNIF